ncbi:uncharacterized protein ACB058_020002 isoform 2-T2 [Synchiropus picturatus]
MSLRATEVPGQECFPSSPPLPADHVLSSGAVLFPGAFDQHGCPLVIFPADKQDKLVSEISKAEVVDFVHYFLCLHKKKQEKCGLVSVVADLREASAASTRLITETLLLLELNQRTVHTVYIIQPRKKETVKLLLKLLAPSARSHTTSLKKVLLKEVSQLSNYIDRSQLTAALGGYLVYCHHSWVAFIKEIYGFNQEFLSVVHKLPRYVTTLQALSRLPLPSTFSDLQNFCFSNEARFEQLRRELGLDDLLKHCENMVEKLRHPEKEPCYQAMAGTALFSQTSYDMLQNHNRIVSAVGKVEQLWQQAFTKARLQLNVFQLREDALQITEQIEVFLQKKLQPYKMEIAKDAETASKLVSEFELSLHSPALALVRRAEDVVHTLAEILLDIYTQEVWVLDLERLKEKLHSTVHVILQTLKTVAKYHLFYGKASRWHTLVLCENFLQDLLSSVDSDCMSTLRQDRGRGTLPVWRRRLSSFLKKHPPPDLEELVHLAHLSNAIPDDEVQYSGQQMSQRCITLRKLLLSPGPVTVGHMQLALKWQYELLRSQSSPKRADSSFSDLGGQSVSSKEADILDTSTIERGTMFAQGKNPFNSASHGARVRHLEPQEVMDGPYAEVRRPKKMQLHTDSQPETSLPVENSSKASIQIIPKVTNDSLNFEIKVKRAAARPSNPWLSLPVEDLENSYTVTITQNQTPQNTDLQLDSPSQPAPAKGQTLKREMTSSTHGVPASRDQILRSHSTLEDSSLSPIHRVLSSTITEGPDQSSCTTEGLPTLLWDSYDLHDQNTDPSNSVIDLSLEDWDVKQQEELREVEKILDHTQEILEEEENVLAQEVLLEALVRSEENHWPAWDSEERLGDMSSSDLADAGILGFEDVYEASSQMSEEAPTFERKSGGEMAIPSRPDLLMELKKVHDLDEQIMEENFKLNKLRESEAIPKPGSSRRSSVRRKEREAFREQLEKEKREVEKLENSLASDHKAKSKASKVVKCSIMEKARTECLEDQALCGLLLSASKRSSTENVLQSQPEAPDVSQDPSADSNASDTVQTVSSSNGFNSDSEELDGKEADQKPDLTECPDTRCKSGVIIIRTSSATNDEPEVNAVHPPVPLPRSSLQVLDHQGSQMSDVQQELVKDEQPSAAEDTLNTLSSGERDIGSPDSLPGPVSGGEGDHRLVQSATMAEGQDGNQAEVHSLNLNEECNNCNNNNNSTPRHMNSVKVELADLNDGFLKSGGPSEVLVKPEELLHDPDGRCKWNGDQAGGDKAPELMKISAVTQVQLDVRMATVSEFCTPVVLDSGSGLIKAGLADQDLPSVVFPTIIGQPKYEEVMNGSFERDTYIGHEAQQMRGVLALRHPVKNGIVCNWDEMEKIWHHAFQQLRVDPEAHPVLLTEAAMNPVNNRQRSVEIMFESINVPYCYVAMQPVLALYSAGRCTGVVFESGDGVSHSVPVFDGYSLAHAVQRFPLAGSDVTMHLKKLLQEQGVSLRTSAELEIVREMKEKCCCVAQDYEKEMTQGAPSMSEMCFTMPDGQVVTLGTERFRAPEILFKPEQIGRDHRGMHESVFKSVINSDIDLRRSLLGNIVLSGGNTLLPGLPERLQSELRALVPGDVVGSVRVSSPTDRDFSVWRGGAVLASMQSFCSAWISLEEYEECGPQIVLRKCF